jgi:hypothetical protein
MEQDGDENGGVNDTFDGVFLSAGQEEHLPRTEFLRSAKCGECDPSFQALNRDFTGNFMGRDSLPCRQHKADDFQMSGLYQGHRQGTLELFSQRMNLDDLGWRGMGERHCSHLLFGLILMKLIAVPGIKAKRPSSAPG